MSTDEQQQQLQPPPASRRRGGLAATRGGHQESERSFFCRVCQRAERGVWVPAGWYLLERAPGGKGRHIRLGLYCSVACLVRAGEMLGEGAAEHAARLDLPTEADRRRERERVIEVAQTLLSGGLSIRQAAESLHVATFTLKAWLKEAGIQIVPASISHTATPTPASGAPVLAPGEHHPVSVLNEWTQQGRIDGIDWHLQATGPSHAPAFTATATTHPAGSKEPISAQGSGASKTAARAAAAAALLAQLTSS
ncbi:putative dsRNA-binding protein [Streptosporangium lutulentum]|uniref:DsRNA-specific ribonuclease n=1 Tax=Streptosporangium lutulentum TaxID=1461250 RepID=A0ABT9QN04_9ACTN|nr:putative dsRNA-binding protein [Streptosporangium lutulentum]MDP9848128.1 dsRNA-specific ribonuclease [Streptosporangium lutulentum]